MGHGECEQNTGHCPYMKSVEDRICGTNYPACTCGTSRCNEYNGYCPVRDGR